MTTFKFGKLLLVLASLAIVLLAKQVFFQNQTLAQANDLVGEQTGVITSDLIGEQTGTIPGDLVGEQTGTIPGDLVGEQTGVIPSCDFVFKYPECDVIGPGWVHEVWQDCNGTYLTKSPHFQGGVCGDVTAPVTSCPVVFQYPECDSTGPGWVHEAWRDCNGNWQIKNVHFQGGVCGHSFATTPQPTGPVSGGAGGSTTTPITVAPITVVPVFTPVFVPVFVPSELVTCSNGFGQQICDSNIVNVQQIQNNNQTVTSTSNASTGPISVTVH